MTEPARAGLDASAGRPPAILAEGPAADLAGFARACRAAARAVSLYPAGHPAIETTLSRLSAIANGLTARHPFRVQALAGRLLIDGAGPAHPDRAIVEVGTLLHRHLVGALTVNPGARPDSWRSLLLLLARAPEDLRANGGIGRLWASAGEPSLEIQEVDYAEALREKQGRAQAVEDILAAAMAGPQVNLDEALATLIREALGDPVKLDLLMAEIDRIAAARGTDDGADMFLNLLRGMVKAEGGDLDELLARFRDAARRLSPGSMLGLIGRREGPDAMVGEVNVVGAVLDGMTDDDVAGFVAGAVVADRGASERLAYAFSALVPDIDRQRQLLARARTQVASSELGDEPAFPELWQGVESMLGSYSDATFVSTEYARELSSARTQPVDLEQVTEDPPERVSAWLASVADVPLRALDRALLVDLLVVELDPLRWRDMADTVMAHADELVGEGCFDQAWQLVEAVIEQGAAPVRQLHATAALERFGGGGMMKHVAAHLRQAGDAEYGRFMHLCHAIGTAVVAPLAEALSGEQEAHARARLRDILVGFGPPGRESVQQLMHASNWEVRRVAAYLLREFGGAEGLKELVPLLADPEPLVRREAVQCLVLNGSRQAAEILLLALRRAQPRDREALGAEILGIRDERASALFAHLVRTLDRRALPRFYLAVLVALSASRSDDASGALDYALRHRDWRTPMLNRQFRAAAAGSLRRMDTPASLEALRGAASAGPRGSRAAARSALAGRG